MKKKQEEEYDPTQDMNRLEVLIERCRVKYEMYFSGAEKKEPHYLRRECKKLLNFLRRKHFRKVSIRFRIEGLAQKYAVLERYWERVKYAREKGTYHKDLMRARRRGLISDPNKETMEEGATQEQQSKVYDIKPEKTRPQDIDPGIPKERVVKIYQQFLKAREECGQSTEKVNVTSVARTIAKQMPQLEKKGYTDIDFRVVVRDGKAALKAVGKKKKTPPPQED